MAAGKRRGRTADGGGELRGTGLRHVSDHQPGIRRLRRGKAFQYLDVRGKPLRDEEQLRRIRSLAIPPAYRKVWICASANGHLQATGYDDRGRKQYRYHPRWRELRDCAKFDRMVQFGAALPKLRRRLRQDLKLPGLPREKVLALVVKLLDSTRSRVGNRAYARDNGSYGLTTLRSRHAEVGRGRLRLHFPGKGGQEHELMVEDPRVARIVRRCKELPGQQLFQYLDEDGQRRGIDSGDVNEYIAQAMGGDFTAKDFRTWWGTLRALALLAAMPLPERVVERRLKSDMAQVVEQVAAELRNTPAVCRKSYINPLVFDAWREGLQQGLACAGSLRGERWALSFLRRHGRRARPSASA